MLDNNHRILSINGLRFNANLGILAHEKTAPQAIQVDADIKLSTPPLQDNQDAIVHVLDYRKVHTLIIETCTAKHVNLLESLTGKLCLRHRPGDLSGWPRPARQPLGEPHGQALPGVDVLAQCGGYPGAHHQTAYL